MLFTEWLYRVTSCTVIFVHSVCKIHSYSSAFVLILILLCSYSPCVYNSYQNVQIMGSFDGWSHGEAMSREYSGDYARFSATLRLRPGRYVLSVLRCCHARSDSLNKSSPYVCVHNKATKSSSWWTGSGNCHQNTRLPARDWHRTINLPWNSRFLLPLRTVLGLYQITTMGVLQRNPCCMKCKAPFAWLGLHAVFVILPLNWSTEAT